MGEAVCKCGVKRQSGYLYFVNKDYHCARVAMARAERSQEAEVLHKCGIKRERPILVLG